MNKQAQNLTLQSIASDSIKLSEFFTEYTKTLDMPEEIYNDLRLVIEEVFVNIISYAYTDECQTITIELSSTPSEISITFIDTGIAFDPLTEPTESRETKDHCEGGMGIHIIKSLSDNLNYNRIGQRNVLTVTKHYTKQQ